MHDVVYFLHAKNSWILQQKLTKKKRIGKIIINLMTK